MSAAPLPGPPEPFDVATGSGNGNGNRAASSSSSSDIDVDADASARDAFSATAAAAATFTGASDGASLTARPPDPADQLYAGQGGASPPRPFRGRTGVVLINIGTPASLSVADVREYLRQFLGDDRVVDIEPRWLKRVLLAFLLLTRPKQSAEAYANIWDAERGSPLLFHSEDLARKLQARLGDASYEVALGMQFCEPNLAGAFQRFRSRGVDRIVVVPMFPQYASSTTGSAVEMAYREAAKVYSTPYLYVVPAFYDHPGYVCAYAKRIRAVLGMGSDEEEEEEEGEEEKEEGGAGQREKGATRGPDHLLMSFHGVPEPHCERTDETGAYCMKQENCCARLTQANRNCYRAQCFATARLLAKELGMHDEQQYSVAFQSRLTAAGPEWIKPYTDYKIVELAERRGVKHLAVVVPSFTADCLETLEEIGMQGREQFVAAGGERLTLVPCLNATDAWADGLVDIIRDSNPVRHAV